MPTPRPFKRLPDSWCPTSMQTPSFTWGRTRHSRPSSQGNPPAAAKGWSVIGSQTSPSPALRKTSAGSCESCEAPEILAKLRVVPRPPARSVEMVADRVVLVVHRKSDINEEDLINASVVVYGNGPELQFKRFGPRCFFSPGPLEQGKIGLLEESSDDGGVVLQAFELDGTMLWSEPVHGRGAKVMVSP